MISSFLPSWTPKTERAGTWVCAHIGKLLRFATAGESGDSTDMSVWGEYVEMMLPVDGNGAARAMSKLPSPQERA